MDVSNASGYDGTTVAADACYVARGATRRTKVVVAETLNPQVRQVVRTFAPGFGMEVVEVPHDGGTHRPRRDPGRGRGRRVRDLPAAQLLRLPRARARHRRRRGCGGGALPVAHVDLMSLGVLEAPGDYGCALAIGEGQSAGNHMTYGGPHYGFMAAQGRAHPPAARAGSSGETHDLRRERAGTC